MRIVFLITFVVFLVRGESGFFLYAEEPKRGYYPSGELKWEISQKGDGLQRYYRRDGSLEREIMIKNGRFNGWYRQYNHRGKLRYQGFYKNGQRHGVHRYYYSNGKLKSLFSFKKGRLHGTCRFYDEKGKLKYISIWRNGKRIREIKK